MVVNDIPGISVANLNIFLGVHQNKYCDTGEFLWSFFPHFHSSAFVWPNLIYPWCIFKADILCINQALAYLYLPAIRTLIILTIRV